MHVSIYTPTRPNSISSVSSSGIVSGLGITNISLSSIARASLRYSSACGHGGVPLDDRFPVDFRPLHVVVAGQEMDHLGADLRASSSIISRSLSTLRLLQIRPPRRTPPASAYLRMPLQMLLAAYMAIISPEQTM